MRVELQPCWILHRRPWRESSLLIEIFTRDHGRLGLVAKGARRPGSSSRGLTEPFIALSCSWTRRTELGTLTGLEATTAGLALKGRALWCGLYLNELIMTLFGRDDPVPELFDAYSASLPALTDHDRQAEALRRAELTMLSVLGVMPDLTRCAGSDEPIVADGLYHVVPEAGLVAVDSTGGGVIEGRTALYLAGLNEDPVDARMRREARVLTRCLIDHQLAGRVLKTRELLAQGQMRQN
jgi:DNA repair protein RecO (recombination protein O)